MFFAGTMGSPSRLEGESEGRGIKAVPMCNLIMELNPTHCTFKVLFFPHFTDCSVSNTLPKIQTIQQTIIG